MNNYQYLRFFNKRGEYCNFQYEDVNDKWIGRIDMQTVSEGLFENEQIFLLDPQKAIFFEVILPLPVIHKNKF